MTGRAVGAALLTLVVPIQLAAQAPRAQAPDVIQIVTFKFAPGEAARAIVAFRELALPLYAQDTDMLEFRAYREVESPSSLDLVVISHFSGMAGMDRSNARLRELTTESGSSIGAVYGAIGALSIGHTDEFIELAIGSKLASMDGSRLVVLEYLETDGHVDYTANRGRVLPSVDLGASGGIAGPVVIGDGWGAFRMYGVESLGAVHDIARAPQMAYVGGHAAVTRRKRLVLAPVPELSVR